MDEAWFFFTRTKEKQTDDNDMAAGARCSNNHDIIATMQGDYRRAVIAYTRAIAAYEQAHFHRGVAEARHNLGIVCRAQGELDRALGIAEQAVRESERLGDQQLPPPAIAGLAANRLGRGASRP